MTSSSPKKDNATFLEKLNSKTGRDAMAEIGRAGAEFISSQLRRQSPLMSLLVVLKPPYRTSTDADGIVHKTAQEDDPINEETRRHMCTFNVAVDDQELRTVTCIGCLTIAT